MNRRMRNTVVLLLCFIMALNTAAVAAAQETEYIQISDTLEVRSALFDMTSPDELSVYRGRLAEGDFDRVVEYFELQGGEKTQNDYYQMYMRNRESFLLMRTGVISLSMDGDSGRRLMNDYTYTGSYYDAPVVWAEEMVGWQNELSYMPRAEAAQMVQKALNDLYDLEAFEQQVEVYAIASSGSELDCYLVDVGFELNEISVTHKWRRLFSGWESYGMHICAIVDERGIRNLESFDYIYTMEEVDEAVPVLDFEAAFEIYQRSYGDLLIDDCIQLDQAKLQYIPLPMQGRQNVGRIEMRPVWWFQYKYVSEEWRRSSYIDAITGVEYDMQ